MKEEFNLSEKEIIKFVRDNFSYSDIGMNEEGDYGENKLNWIWEEGFEGKLTRSLRNKIIQIIKHHKKNYYK